VQSAHRFRELFSRGPKQSSVTRFRTRLICRMMRSFGVDGARTLFRSKQCCSKRRSEIGGRIFRPRSRHSHKVQALRHAGITERLFVASWFMKPRLHAANGGYRSRLVYRPQDEMRDLMETRYERRRRREGERFGEAENSLQGGFYRLLIARPIFTTPIQLKGQAKPGSGGSAQ